MKTDRPFYKLNPNRVWRTYQGGRLLDTLAGSDEPGDSHFPEDWIGSLTEATNPPGVGGSNGLATVEQDGTTRTLRELMQDDPEYFLGAAHVARFGADPRILVKFIDASIRLHLQVHPTAEFAQLHLNSPVGKTEAYYVLEARPENTDPYVCLGFHTPPTREELREWIETQNIAALLERMNRVSVRPGDVLLVPGGTPHALGENLFLIELQEASDLVVRFEFERGGYTLPEEARFMQRGLDFCLDVFATEPCREETIEQELSCRPQRLQDFSAGAWRDRLIGPAQTPRFRLDRLTFSESCEPPIHEFTIGIVTEGACELSNGTDRIRLHQYEKCVLPAGLGEIRLEPLNGEPCTLLLCCPPEE